MEKENEKPIKPQKGFWDNMDTECSIRPNIRFEINVPVEVIMQSENPREIEYNDSVFYVFDVICKNEELSIATSSWSLLKGLKKLEPIVDKRFRIVKKMIKGKQTFEVEELK